MLQYLQLWFFICSPLIFVIVNNHLTGIVTNTEPDIGNSVDFGQLKNVIAYAPQLWFGWPNRKSCWQSHFQFGILMSFRKYTEFTSKNHHYVKIGSGSTIYLGSLFISFESTLFPEGSDLTCFQSVSRTAVLS